MALCIACNRSLPENHFNRTPTNRLTRKCIECSRGRSTHTPQDNSNEALSRQLAGLVTNQTAAAESIAALTTTLAALQRSIEENTAREAQRDIQFTTFNNELTALRTGQPPANPAIPAPAQGAAAQGSGSGAAAGVGGVLPPLNPGEYLAAQAVALSWVKEEIVRDILHDTFEPEDLVKLRHKSLFVGQKAESDDQGVSIDENTGFMQFKAKKDTKQSAFLKAIPNVTAFIQVWLLYIAIKSMKPDLPSSMIVGYSMHGHDIVHKASKHPWEKVAEYHLDVHRERMKSKAPAAEWMKSDVHLSDSILSASTLEKSSGPSQNGNSNNSSRSAPYTNTNNTNYPFQHSTCRRFNKYVCNLPCPSGYAHLCAKCNGMHPASRCNQPTIMGPPVTNSNNIQVPAPGQGASST